MRSNRNKKGFTMLIVILLSTAIMILAVGVVTLVYRASKNYSEETTNESLYVETENEAKEYFYTNGAFDLFLEGMNIGDDYTKSFGNGILTVKVEKTAENSFKITEWKYKG